MYCISECPINSSLIKDQCECNSGYITILSLNSIKIQTMECVCNSPLPFSIDFYFNPSSTEVCCPANSTNINGKCECDY